MCDVYAVIEASRLLDKLATGDVPAPLRQMLIHARQKLDEEIETYFKPLTASDPCAPLSSRHDTAELAAAKM